MSDELQTLRSALAGQFDVMRELGHGGMGVVALARDLKLDRLVAIKVLPSSLSSDDARTRFLREARTAAQLAHPNIVPIYRADEVEGLAFFVMGYIDGESLAERVQLRGALPVADVIPWLREVAWALAYAHARGVVHRDVKPENIMLERATNRAIVTDFGIARDAAADGLTATGHVLGTVHYMSPEQSSGDPLDGRSDLYALGVVGFHLLSGRVPFEGLAAHAVLVANAMRPAPSLCEVAPQVPHAVGAVIDRCLSKRPDDRYATGEQLADALAKALADAERDARTSDSARDAVVSEAAAEALWRRAAQLQAESLQRIDARRAGSALPATTSTGATPVTGYRIEHVKQAAVEAGISAQFIELALAELPRDNDGARLRAVANGSRSERYASQMLGTSDKSLSVTRVIHGAPARVLQALGTVWRMAPWSLVLRAPQGGHPLDGGVLVFDLPGAIVSAQGVVSTQWTATRHTLEATQLQVTLRPAPGVADATEVTVFCDLRPGIRGNVLVAWWTGGILGSVGAVLAAGVANKAALIIGALTVVGPAVATGVGAAGLTVVGYRMAYRSAVRSARAEIEKALDAVEGGLQSEQLFGLLR